MNEIKLDNICFSDNTRILNHYNEIVIGNVRECGLWIKILTKDFEKIKTYIGLENGFELLMRNTDNARKQYYIEIIKALAKIKGVIALSLYLMLFALEAAKMCKIIGRNEYDTWVREFEKVSGAHEKMIVATKKFYADNIKALTSLQTVYICSVGANMGTAMEGALKVGETIQVPGIAYELEEYIHGPNLQLTPNYTVFFIDGGLASDRTQEIFEATGVITDKTYMLTNKKGLEGKNIINPDFEINELITPLAFLPFFQILSYQITEDTHKWKKHPLMDEMKRLAGAKTLNYESSPLRKDMPQ